MNIEENIEDVKAYVGDLMEFIRKLDRNINGQEDLNIQFHVSLREEAEKFIALGDSLVEEWERFREFLPEDESGGGGPGSVAVLDTEPPRLDILALIYSNRYKSKELTRSFEETVDRLEVIEDALLDCLEHFADK